MNLQDKNNKIVYNKINKQTKFQLLHRVLDRGQPVDDVAIQLGIHFSTAKTIIFFHRHQHKSYKTFKIEQKFISSVIAGYKQININQENHSKIEIVCNSDFFQWDSRKQKKSGNVLMTYQRNKQILVARKYHLRKSKLLKKAKKKSEETQLNNGQQNSSSSQGQSQFLIEK